MKCSVVRKNILRWSDGEKPDVGLLKAVDEHLAQCESCTQWREYLKVFEDGPEGVKIPAFEMSSLVAQGIREANIQAVPSARFQFVPSFRFSAVAAMVVLIALVGVYRFAIYESSEAIRMEWVQSNGQTYQVISSNRSSSFNPNYLKPMATPALQSQVRRQLGFLTDSLASALLDSRESINWEELHQELEDQELEIPGEEPEFLVISEGLTQLLETDVRNEEIWIVQPADSVLMFTLVEDRK